MRFELCYFWLVDRYMSEFCLFCRQIHVEIKRWQFIKNHNAKHCHCNQIWYKPIWTQGVEQKKKWKEMKNDKKYIAHIND